jgi:hypothetical protein
MILYDHLSDSIINILDYNVIPPTQTRNPIYYNPMTNNILTIRTDKANYGYFEEWIKSTYDNSGMVNSARSYKREIYILSSQMELQFNGSFIRDISIDEEGIVSVSINSDHHTKSFGKHFPQLLKVHRDKKIDQILD